MDRILLDDLQGNIVKKSDSRLMYINEIEHFVAELLLAKDEISNLSVDVIIDGMHKIVKELSGNIYVDYVDNLNELDSLITNYSVENYKLRECHILYNLLTEIKRVDLVMSSAQIKSTTELRNLNSIIFINKVRQYIEVLYTKTVEVTSK